MSGISMRSFAVFFGLALMSTTAASAQTAAPPPKGAPPYVVVQGVSNEVATAGTKLTVLCPTGHRAFGAGYSALVRAPARSADAPPVDGEGGLDEVRSMPDVGGEGWQVSGVSPDAVRLKQPWRLVVRVVCVQG
jgi:hypothetical protein